MFEAIIKYFLNYVFFIVIEMIVLMIVWVLNISFPSFYSNISTGGFISELRRMLMLSTIYLPPIIFIVVAFLFELKCDFFMDFDKKKKLYVVFVRFLILISFIGAQILLFLELAAN